MRIEMRAQMSGTRNGVDWPAPGEVIDLPDVEAAALVADGLAVESAPVFSDAADEPAKRTRRKADD